LLEVKNLQCVRGDRSLFSDLSFTLEPSQLLHITGANGSGKTTLLRALCGLTLPASGQILWQGTSICDLAEDYHQHLTYVGHPNAVNGELTALENLTIYAKLWGDLDRASIRQVLGQVGLTSVPHLPAKLLSQGQKRRIALARLLVTKTPLWILDEPLTALDANTIAYIGEVVALHLKNDGMIVITSHQTLKFEVSVINTIALS